MKVSIVIPNWNGAGKLKRNLPKVLKVKGVFEVIVVDDASTDDSVKVIKENFPQVKLIEKRKNTGFGSNVNLGVSHSSGELIFLVNSDASPEEDCLKYILPHFEDPKVFSVSCNTGGNWSWAKWEKGYFWHYSAPKEGDVKTHETLWASGGSGVFKKQIWDELGGLDPLYDPFYVEDVDLGYRAWKRGYKNIWEAKAKVLHYKEVGVIASHFSLQRIQNTTERNTLIFIWKNIHDKKMIREHLFALTKRILIHPKYLLIFLRAVVLLSRILEERAMEKKAQVASDKEILGKYSG